MQIEQSQHEAIKTLLKQAVDNNPTLSELQKHLVKQQIDIAAQQADWVMEILKQCGWLQ